MKNYTLKSGAILTLRKQMAYIEQNNITIALGNVNNLMGELIDIYEGRTLSDEEKESESEMTDEDRAYNELEEKGLEKYKGY